MESHTSFAPVESGDELSDSYRIVTAVRIRPLSEEEIQSNRDIIASTPAPGEIVLTDPTYFTYSRRTERERQSCERKFCFDCSFCSNDTCETGFVASQSDIYESLGKPMLRYVMKGQNCTLFAYGQTGSGKTYTMMGGDLGTLEEGLTPRLCRDILLEVTNMRGTQDISSGGTITESKMQLAFFEIYNERVHDLLRENPEEPCRVREHPDTGAFVEGLTYREVDEMAHVASTIQEGVRRRQTAETLMNAQSSRSHAVLTILVTQEVVLSFGTKGLSDRSITSASADSDPSERKAVGTPPPRRMKRNSSRGDASGRRSIMRVGKVCLVDLAGSERLYSTGATGQRRKEGTYINLSLSTLGDVIKALSERSDKDGGAGDVGGKFIPYRNSVLTYVLKDSIGGNSRTSIIATISPTMSAYSESLNTLRFITKAKLISNRVSVNESSADSKYIQNLHKQIALYKSKLASTISEMQQREASYETQISSLKNQLAAANEIIASSSPSHRRNTSKTNVPTASSSSISPPDRNSSGAGSTSVLTASSSSAPRRTPPSRESSGLSSSGGTSDGGTPRRRISRIPSLTRADSARFSDSLRRALDDATESREERIFSSSSVGSQVSRDESCDDSAPTEIESVGDGRVRVNHEDSLDSIPSSPIGAGETHLKFGADSEWGSPINGDSGDAEGVDSPSSLRTVDMTHGQDVSGGDGERVDVVLNVNSISFHSSDNSDDYTDTALLLQQLNMCREEVKSLQMSLFSTQEENKFLEHQLAIVDRDLQWLLMPSE